MKNLREIGVQGARNMLHCIIDGDSITYFSGIDSITTCRKRANASHSRNKSSVLIIQ